MNMKTLLLYTAIVCGGGGAAALIWPHVTSGDVAQVSQEESVNTHRSGPPPNRIQAQGF